MAKYEYTKKCREISGFGGGYEDACRKMVITGMGWLEKHKEANPTNEDMKAMQSAMNEAIGDESSGAMMQACTNHVLFASKNGWEKYISEMESHP